MNFINKIQQQQQHPNTINDNHPISNSTSSTSSDETIDNVDNVDDNDEKTTILPAESFKPLPSILIDFFALTICDFLPMKRIELRTAPELMYFIQKITYHARISCHIAVVALIYIDRCKAALPKNARGDQDTAHRILIASLLAASKFLHGTRWGSSQQLEGSHDMADENKPCWLTNQKMSRFCGNMYTLHQINELERSFLKLIQYKCWVDDDQVQDYLVQHRQELLL
ncbi:hypothetical protein BCR42DRAFT_324625 [Absidia repens]|uniref:Cyclin N-terminal domain-containing protein n=1 Tax=Absidia repens TaxID=90262 RepID=A0A1X2ILK4_9FUNG|nr:hypothetical protein BCR42DRAFT_324625 [Absidia repens]